MIPPDMVRSVTLFTASGLTVTGATDGQLTIAATAPWTLQRVALIALSAGFDVVGWEHVRNLPPRCCAIVQSLDAADGVSWITIHGINDHNLPAESPAPVPVMTQAIFA